MNTLEKAELTTSICQTEKFSKSGIPIYNSQALCMTGRKTRKRTQSNVNCYVFHAGPMTVFSKMQATVITIALHSK